MSNSEGTPGGVGSPQGGQAGWDDAENTQPIPPSSEGTTSAGMTGTVYDPAAEELAMTKAQTDKQREAEQAKTGITEPTPVESTDPADQPNFGLPDGVTTSQTRGENDTDEEPVNPEGEPNPTVEEQLGQTTDETTEG